MRTSLSAALLVVGLLAPACRHASGGVSAWAQRFGPIVGTDTIVGRTYRDGRALLLTDRPALITVDVRGEWATQRPVTDRGADVLWGLARLDDGSVWTLAGQRALGRIDADGRISERIPLAAPHVGVFSAGGQLVYQVLDFRPPAAALVIGPPGEHSRHPWSRMQTRRYALARVSVAALNLVSCGGTDAAEIPCWFPDEPAVTLVGSSGESRRIVLAGLPEVAPEILLTSDNPPRPVRDVFVAASGDVWVLGSGASPHTQTSGMPGGHLLARYDATGRLIRQGSPPVAVRLILHATADRCLVLASDGFIVEVRL